VLLVRPPALLDSHPRAKLRRPKEADTQGHTRKRAPAGSWEYILDVGRYGAQRCQGCGKRFWIERRPKDLCPACGGQLRETEERRRETKGGFASRKDCQAALTLLAEQQALGYDWIDSRRVFTKESGAELHPERISALFARLVRAAALPQIPLHGLRHTYASLALAKGVNAAIVSRRLGHATVAFTLDIYSHVLPQFDAEAAELIATFETRRS